MSPDFVHQPPAPVVIPKENWPPSPADETIPRKKKQKGANGPSAK